jgi:hypothetical protein
MVGAVVGTPGTLPTFWIETLRGLTRQVVATGVENGVEYIDLRFHGTATSGGAGFPLRIQTEGDITASGGQVWTNSSFLKLIDSTALPVSIELAMGQRATPSGFVEVRSGPLPVDGSLIRYVRTETVSAIAAGNPVDRIFPAVIAILTNGESYDFTIRIGLPQMEQGSSASSVIKTTDTAVTRNADVLTVTGASGVIGQESGAVYCEGFVSSQSGCWFDLLGSGLTVFRNTIKIQNSVTNDDLRVAVGSNTTAQDVITTTKIIGNGRLLLKYQPNLFKLFRNGALGGTYTGPIYPETTMSTIGVGIRPFDNSNSFDNTLFRLAIWDDASKVPDELAEEITTL